MSVYDSRPVLTFEVVVTHITGPGVTVVATTIDSSLAATIKKSLEPVYGKGNVKTRPAVTS